MAKTKKDNEMFLEITNKDVYIEMKNGFVALHDKIDSFCKTNQEDHGEIMSRQDKTNGKVKTSTWMATTGLLMFMALLGWFIAHIGKG